MMTCRECGATAPDGTAGWKTGPTGLQWCPECLSIKALRATTTKALAFCSAGGVPKPTPTPTRTAVEHYRKPDGTMHQRTVTGDRVPTIRYVLHGFDGIPFTVEEPATEFVTVDPEPEPRESITVARLAFI
jgi:hypothetical protein